MIEGPTAVVIFDGQLLLPYASEVASYVQTLGKPVDRIILSHAHTDHWSGLQVLTERFSDARVFALDGVADQVQGQRPSEARCPPPDLRRQGRDEGHRPDGDNHRRSATDRRHHL
jgi:glyoxylase-like metal-dependent hydrolase (beta-lactamase superfamily II)